VKSRQDRVRLILIAVENSMRAASGSKTEEPLANADLSIEHLLPQNGSTANYPYAKNANYKRSTETVEQSRERLVHTLGNLTLLTQPLNSSISNGSFVSKTAEIVEHTVLRLNKFLLGDGSPKIWDEKSIISRGQLLYEYVRSIWPIPEKHSNESNVKTVRDDKAIAEKRKLIVGAINKKFDLAIVSKSGALFESKDGKVRAVCAVSKRYDPPRSPYWYQYSPQWQEFLSGAATALFVLGCMDKNIAFAVPNAEIENVLGALYLTPQRHWHIVLEETNDGQISLVTRNGAKLLMPFIVDIEPT
jgi:hypothetical protein